MAKRSKILSFQEKIEIIKPELKKLPKEINSLHDKVWSLKTTDFTVQARILTELAKASESVATANRLFKELKSAGPTGNRKGPNKGAPVPRRIVPDRKTKEKS